MDLLVDGQELETGTGSPCHVKLAVNALVIRVTANAGAAPVALDSDPGDEILVDAHGSGPEHKSVDDLSHLGWQIEQSEWTSMVAAALGDSIVCFLFS